MTNTESKTRLVELREHLMQHFGEIDETIDGLGEMYRRYRIVEIFERTLSALDSGATAQEVREVYAPFLRKQ